VTYRKVIPIEFNHCDPAGIVFYPRYFEMTNSVVENFFADVLGMSFAEITMRQRRGVPTVRIESNFTAPSSLGDKVEFTLDILKIGKSSVSFRVAGSMQGEQRLSADLTLVWIGTNGRAEPWPDPLRAALTQFKEKAA
jgi:4-hydroxybenzoyl-CoA thioesterase